MRKIHNTDYVIYNKTNNHVCRFKSDKNIVIFGSFQEADDDCMGNEEATRCVDLPSDLKTEILNQINLKN